MELIEEFACAKVNLTLEVLGRRTNGYHALQSLVAFALDASDHLTLAPGANFSLVVTGPEAAAIDSPNLINATVEHLKAQQPACLTGHFHLDKRLPVASGIGGGSADAAAALRAIARANKIPDPDGAFAALAASLGADIPVCIGYAQSTLKSSGSRAPTITAAFMSGIGEKVWRPSVRTLLPPGGLTALLVNPRLPVPTGAVFEALAAQPIATEPEVEPPTPFETVDACIAYVAASRNDLEAPAIATVPIIADVLAVLRAVPGCRLARMSGSGATCFALFGDLTEAQRAGDQLRRSKPAWWIQPTRLV